MKIESKKSGLPPRAFRSSKVVQYLITTGLFALYHCTVAIFIVPVAWGFIPRIRSIESDDVKHHVSKTKYYFADRETTDQQGISASTDVQRKSVINSIRCENLASMTNGQRGESTDNESTIVVNFDERAPAMFVEEYLEKNVVGSASDEFSGNLICVTGETGSGKSLLVSKVADLLTGGTASASLLHSPRSSITEQHTAESSTNTKDNDDRNGIRVSDTSVEMAFSLYDESHVTFVSNILRQMGQDPAKILQRSDSNNETEIQQRDDCVTLRLKRILSIAPTSMNANRKSRRQRAKSLCFINDHSVPLKVLKAISSRLVAVVNAPAATTALGIPGLRLSMIDSGIPLDILTMVQNLQKAYHKCKKYRESLEKELEQQVLSAGMVQRNHGDGENDHQMELLQHWVEELDGFERRVSDFQHSVCAGGEQQIGDEDLENFLGVFDVSDWSSGKVDDNDTPSMYEILLDLHDYLKSLDTRIETAMEARDALGSLSTSDSARTALDRTRQLLLDAAASPQQTNSNRNGSNSHTQSNRKSKTTISAERAHEMLNLVEDALVECVNFLDDDDKGIVATLRTSRTSVPVSTDDVFEYISEWNVLARKHGVPPYQLPLCHTNLKNELDGGIEARRLLPEAKIAEKNALDELEKACQVLSEARNKVCQRVSDSISHRLPRLGMENSKFEARLSRIKNPSYSGSHLGVDQIDFYLLHEDLANSIEKSNGKRTDLQDRRVGGKIETVASSGEKARLLLAIECEIPGSISSVGNDVGEAYQSSHVSPVAVIYDEIDAHVGGRASVAVAQMLFDQSKACQVVSITHSPSLAAIADTHICVERGKSNTNGRSFDVLVNRVEGKERRKELARMASGDTVVDEAEVFADALLRDASTIKSRTQNLKP